jgi:proteasome lid subunit RPN8/RPN11
VCGVLVGEWKRDSTGPFVEVRHIIESNAARSGPAEVTFTHDTWAAINREMDTKYHGQRIVGWYHTHPDFGIFLSDYDVFIHRHFFAGAGQIAWVIDPIRNQEGVFRWRDNRPTLTPQFWVGNSIRPAPPPAGGALGAMSASTARPAAVPSAARGPRLLAGLDWSAFWQIAALLFLGSLLGHMYSAWTDSQREQNQRTALTIEFFKTRLLRVGLEQVTHEAHADVNQLASGLRRLESHTKEPTGMTPEQVTSELATMRQHLDHLEERLQIIDRNYALSTREQEQLARFLLAQTAIRAQPRTGPATRAPAEGDEKQPPPPETAAPGGAGEPQPNTPPRPQPASPQEAKPQPPAGTGGTKTD